MENYEINQVLEQTVKVKRELVEKDFLIKDIIKELDVGDIVYKNDNLIPNFAIVFALASSYQKKGFDLELIDECNIRVKDKFDENKDNKL